MKNIDSQTLEYVDITSDDEEMAKTTTAEPTTAHDNNDLKQNQSALAKVTYSMQKSKLNSRQF